MSIIVALVFLYIFLFGGGYLVAWGLNLIVKGSVSLPNLFTQPLFWGIYAIMAGFCLVFTVLWWDKIK